MTPKACKIRATIANRIARDPDADVTELRRELRAERLAEQIDAVAPELTAEQRATLAALLRPAGAGADAA